MRVREKYRGLSREELLDKAYELGANYEKYSRSCCQSTVASLHELLDIDDIVVKVATTSAGGQAAQVAGTCGALIGGTMILDYFFGRPLEKVSHQETIQSNLDALMNALEVAGLPYDKFIKEYGTILCPHIQAQLFGRHYYFLDPDDNRKFDEAGGHEDKCTSVVGKAARWVMEILLDRGLER